MTPPLRVAIYTRKSTDEGLEMAFNSLEAQYEACLAYVALRRHLGWQVVPERYDDGGYTGGNLERPALQRLLADVRQGRIQVVVTYKLDRISRSLLDFANLMTLFEHHQVAFVSTTQEFDSSTPVGRLTLNILSSFAQYEREIIRERTHDKMAASRRRGMYTGGIPPFGYALDRVTHTLVIDPAEAAVVRRIFAEYLTCRSVIAVMRALNADGIPTKRHKAATGRAYDGGRWSNAYVRKLLENPLYRGQIRYQGQCYAGQHPAIIDTATWERVQACIKKDPRSPRTPPQQALLKGLLRCGHCGCAMTPASSREGPKVYRYYLCSTSHRHGTRECPTRSIPAGPVEALVLEQIQRLLQNPDPIVTALAAPEVSPARRQAGLTLCHTLHTLAGTWPHGTPATQQAAVRQLVAQVAVHADHLVLELAASGAAPEEGTFSLALPLNVTTSARRQLAMVMPDTPTPLQVAVARAWIWRQQLDAGRYRSVAELAAAVGADATYVAAALNLALLAPDLVAAIMAGEPMAHPPLTRLPKTWPLAWSAQRALLARLCQG